MTAAGPAIVVRGLAMQYGGRTVLDGLDLEVQRGQLLALLGPNGAGKTTTIEILEGYRVPDHGVARVLGMDPRRGGPAWRARIGLMLQDGGVDPRVSPREVIALFARFHQAPRNVDELLDLVGLREVAGTRYRRLSGGERQRLGLALALVGRPELLFLDEPTAGMDPHARASTRQLLRELRDAGLTILLTTHDLSDVERVADRVAILHRGRLVADGSPATVAATSTRGLALRFDAPPDAASLRDALAPRWPLAAVGLDSADPSAVLVQGVEPEPALVATVAAWAAREGRLITVLEAGVGSLEQRYLELTTEREPAG